MKPQPTEPKRFRTAAAANFFAAARPGNWFASKIPPLLAVAYLAILHFGIGPRHAAQLLLCGLFSIFSVAIYGHVINDIFDQDSDRLANKVNHAAALPPVCRVLLISASLLAGFLPAMVARYSAGVLSLLTLNFLWPTLYSIPTTRWKEKDLLGVACDVLGAHITPTLFVVALFAGPSPGITLMGQPGFALVATLWAAVLGIKGILHHQIGDRDNDARSGIATFATKTSLDRLQRFLTGYHLLIELPVSALFTTMVCSWCPLAIVGFVIYTAFEAMKYKLGFKFALSADPATIRASVPFTNELFYVLWMPMAAAIQLGLDMPALISLPLIHLVTFHRVVLQQLGDWRAVIQNFTLEENRAKQAS